MLSWSGQRATVRHPVFARLQPRFATVGERAGAAAAAHEALIPVIVADGTADDLPLQDASMDGGAVSLVLCSVPDQATALAEPRRVIRPGGQLRFYEHVAAADPASSGQPDGRNQRSCTGRLTA